MHSLEKSACVFVLFLAAACVLPLPSRAESKRAKQAGGEHQAPVLLPADFSHMITSSQKISHPHGKVLSLVYSADGARLAAGDNDKAVTLWNSRGGEELWKAAGLPDKVSSLCYSGDGKYLVAAGQGKDIVFIDPANGTPMASLRAREDVRAAACSPTAPVLAASLDDETITLWNLEKLDRPPAGAKSSKEEVSDWFGRQSNKKREESSKNAQVRIIDDGNEKYETLAFSQDGRILAAGGRSGRVVLFDVQKGTVVRSMAKADKDVRGLVFSPNGTWLAGTYDKKGIAVWNMHSDAPPRIAEADDGDINSLSFNPDGTLLASAGRKRITLWSVATMKALHSFSDAREDNLTLAFTPSGDKLAVAGEDEVISFWNIPGIASLLGASAKDERITLLEAERERKLLALAAPKGEFETSREYESRRKNAKTQEQVIRKEYERKMADVAEQRQREVARVRHILYPYSLTATLGNYDADRERFSATIAGNRVAIKVPVSRAQEFAGKRESVTIEGMMRYAGAGQVELVNASLVDTRSGARYPFGIQVDGSPAQDVREVARVVKQTPKRQIPQLELSAVTLVEPSGNGAIDAGENGAIRLTVKNAGKGEAEGVYVSVQPELSSGLPQGLRVKERAETGFLGPGESRTLDLEVAGGEDLVTRQVKLLLTASDQDGLDSRPVALSFGTRAMVPPELKLARIDITDADGQRRITKGKEATLTYTIHNGGGGEARDVSARIAIDSPNILLLGESEVMIGKMRPGESKKATFTIVVTNRYKGGAALPVSVTLTEERPKFGLRPDVKLVMNEEAPVISQVKVETKDVNRGELEDVAAAPVIPASKRAFGERDLAVVIGIERYQNVPKSDYAYNDALSVREYLLSLGFSERNIEFLHDDRATLSAIRKSVESWLPNRVKPGSRIFFYYSGHGAPDPSTGRSYIFPYDGDASYLRDTGYPVTQLFEKLASAKGSEVLVVMDSCFSGMGGRSVLAPGARPLVMLGDAPAIPKGMAVLTSTDKEQISTSFQEKEHGMFTYYFLRAIKEGKRDLGEVFTYVKPLVEDRAKVKNVIQTPTLATGMKGEGSRFRFVKE